MDTLKKNLRVIALAALAAVVSTASYAADAQNKPAIVVLGDSLSAAEYGLPRDSGWVNLLRDRLVERALRL